MATTEEMYQKVVAVALECGPKPASERGQDTLEPPWLVFRRVVRELAEARSAQTVQAEINFQESFRAVKAEEEGDRLRGALREIEKHTHDSWVAKTARKALAGGEGK